MPGLDPGIHVLIRHATLGSFRRLQFAILDRRQGFGQQRVEQAAAGGGGGGEARLQPVAERHQRIDLGDDAVLFGEGWEGNRNLLDQADVQTCVARASSIVAVQSMSANRLDVRRTINRYSPTISVSAKC